NPAEPQQPQADTAATSAATSTRPASGGGSGGGGVAACRTLPICSEEATAITSYQPPDATRPVAVGEVSSGKAKIGWDPSRVCPGSAAARSSTATKTATATTATATAAAAGVGSAVGWNSSRVGNPAVPAPVKHVVAAAGVAEAGVAEARVAEAGATAGRVDTGGGSAAEQRVAAGRGTGGRRSSVQPEVPLQLRAVLLYASAQRGIDLRRWFDLGGAGEGGDREGEEVVEGAPSLLTVVQFELILTGLTEGLKAGLSKEERDEIDAAVRPEVIAAAVSASAAAAASASASAVAAAASAATAATTAPTAPTATATATTTAASEASRMVDVGRLLGLCGIPSVLDSRGQPIRGPGGGESAGEKVEICRERRGVAAGGGGGNARARARARATLTPEAAAVAEASVDENALRRVTHQADLYGRLSASLGLRQPYGCSSQAAIAEWEASLKRSTVSLRAFRKALGEAGLVLGRTRAVALATRACGPLIPPATSPAVRRPRNGRGRRPSTAPASTAASAIANANSNASTNPNIANANAHTNANININANPKANTNANASTNASTNANTNANTNTLANPNTNTNANPTTTATATANTSSSSGKGVGRGVGTGGGGGGSRGGGGDMGDSRSRRNSSSRRRERYQNKLALPAWDLRTYLLRLRVEPKSQATRDQRRNRFLFLTGRGGHEDGAGERWGEEEEEGVGVAGDDDGGGLVRPADFATWGKRVRGERIERERERKREFQRVLAGQAHSLSREELEECVCSFEIMPPEVMSRELRAMGKAFSESMEGGRRARELVRRWSKPSPAARNACGAEDVEQETWEHAQAFSAAQRKSRAREMVAKERQEELAESEEASASVSRGLFLAYMRSAGGGGEAGGGAGSGGGMSLQRWLEDRQAAVKKARELEAGRERARVLFKADTKGRKVRHNNG
ncbi:unnamed protein product, partial [Laminaria digitata]